MLGPTGLGGNGMMLLPVTLSVAAAAAFGNVALALRIVRIRFSSRISIGDGGRDDLLARSRAHANFAEYVPFALILLALIEAAGGSTTGLGVAGGLLLVARVAHAIGMDRPAPNAWRAGGAMLTWALLVALAAWGLATVVSGWSPAAVTRLPAESVPTA